MRTKILTLLVFVTLGITACAPRLMRPERLVSVDALGGKISDAALYKWHDSVYTRGLDGTYHKVK